MQAKKKKIGSDGTTMELFINFQKLFRFLDFGRSLKGKAPLITVTQMRVLSFFNEKDVVYISEISRRLGMSIQSVNNLVSRLEALGYVERTKNAADKRLSDIRFTKKGRDGFDMFRAEQMESLSLLLQKLDKAERQAVLQSVERAAGLFQKAVIKASQHKTAPAGR